MADVASLSVKISADISDFRKNISQLQSNLKKNLGNDTLQQSQRIATGIGLVTTALGALGGMSIKAAADMEQTKMAFTTLLKDGKKAQAFLTQMEKFAKNTPFDLPGVLEASRQLLAFGFEAERIEPILRSLGDASAALGLGDEGIKRLTLALGQMSAVGKVTTNDMKQIANTGVAAWDMLAQKIGVTVPEAMDMVSKGGIDAQTGINAILEGMDARFGGMMANQEKTILGMWANIQESLSFTLRDIGQNLIDTFDIHGKMERFKQSLETFSDTLKSSGLQSALKTLIPPEMEGRLYMIAGALTAAVIPALTAIALSLLKVNAGLLPIMGVGALAGAAMYALSEAGFSFSESLTMVASVLTVAYLPQIKGFITLTGTGAVAALKGLIMQLGLSGVAFNLSTVAASTATLSFKGLAVATWLAVLPLIKIIAVAAIVAAVAYTIYQNWDRVSSSFGNLGSGLINSVGNLIDVFKPLGKILIVPFLALAGIVVVATKITIEMITDIIDFVVDFASEVGDAMTKAADWFGNLVGLMPGWASGMISWIDSVISKLLEFIGIANQAKIIESVLGGIGESNTVAKDVGIKYGGQITGEAVKGGGVAGAGSAGGGEGGSGSNNKAKELEREINRISEKLLDLKDKARQVGAEFANFKINQFYNDLEGAAAVYGRIDKERIDAINELSDQIKRFNVEQLEAQELYNRAVKAGNDEQIALTKSHLEEITQAKIEAAEYAAQREVEIADRAEKEKNKLSTQQQAYRAELDNYYKEANLQGYVSYLDKEKVAFLTHMSEQQAAMQQYYDWRMEAAQTFLSFQLEAMETLKNGFAEAFSNAITEGENLGKAIQNLGKQIVNMFIQWQIKRLAASMFSKSMGAKDTAMQQAQIASLLPAASALAATVLVYNPGAAAVAQTSLTALQAGSMAIGSAASIFGSFGVSTGLNIPQMAKGGIVTRPTLAVVGEGRESEAIIPLSKLESFVNGGGDSEGGTTVNFNQYGNIQSERDFDSLRKDIDDAIVAALRSG